MLVTASKPEYVIAITQNSPGQLDPGVLSVLLKGTRSGQFGNPKEGAEAVARCQAGDGESYNWLIDTDGTIFELTGWDRAASGSPDVYVIGLAQPTVQDPIRDRQYKSLEWLMRQLQMRRGVPRAKEGGGLAGYAGALGPGFSWARVGL